MMSGLSQVGADVRVSHKLDALPKGNLFYILSFFYHGITVRLSECKV